MGLFDHNSSTGELPPAPRPGAKKLSFPELIAFDVLTKHGRIVVTGHNAQIDASGALQIFRGIFIDEECNQPSAVPARFFAPGEWQQVSTEYEGFKRESPLSL